ncbi:MAG: hypothetical protein J6I42_05750 [Clostridia bacterium]|nr:hypothetical protein [Clostridia bacterium]MBO5258125.1 hypothetical protein [Clostridia bacterium]MBP3695175.1 hypothetical protein [Thermoguttaceae bacterium]
MKRITETIKAVTYEKGSRVAVIEQKISRADDCEELGNLYFRLCDIYRRLEETEDATERDALEVDRVKIAAEIERYRGYLEGYEG